MIRIAYLHQWNLPDDMVSQTELGKWKLEEIIPKGEAEFIAPKHYKVIG